MPESGRTRVYLVDDHEIVRRGVRDMLTADPGLEIAGEAGTAADAITGIAAARPDVAILDVRLPDGSGIEVCREVRSRDESVRSARSRDESVRCLMLTSYADDEALLASVVAGASGYVLKGLTGGELVHAVHQVAAGDSLLDPADTRRVLDRLRDRSTDSARDERLGALSAQERTILGLIGEGLTNRAIGERLHLAEKTVKNYVSGLLGKLGMERRSQAAAYIARIRAAHDD
ncbi:response regulator [Streptomyces qinglanensis]|uniref:response regulator n=1 Tax=Streptomyces qinglanensis TaxID=943816 RepID=UPI00378E1E65